MTQKLTDHTEVLYKQVHPNFYANGVLGSPAFVPNPDDNGFPSSDRSSIVSAQAAHHHFTQNLGKKSVCVFGVTVGEYHAENIDCAADPLPSEGSIPANPAHCLSDYTPFTKNQWKNIAKRLKIKAVTRGRQHP